MKYAKGFAWFWWDLLVADTPELTAGALAMALAAYFIGGREQTLSVLLPLMAIALLAASLVKGARSR